MLRRDADEPNLGSVRSAAPVPPAGRPALSGDRSRWGVMEVVIEVMGVGPTRGARGRIRCGRHRHEQR